MSESQAPMVTDAERLLWLVRRMDTEDFARVFRADLSPQQLMTVITALPTERLNELMDRARQSPGQGDRHEDPAEGQPGQPGTP